MMFTRHVASHNRNTHKQQGVITRAYMVPTSWTPPPTAVLRSGPKVTIWTATQRGPEAWSDPRCAGVHSRNAALNHSTITGEI